MLCVLLLPIAAFLLRAEAAVSISTNHHNNNNNNGNTADTDKWISDKDKYWSKFRDSLTAPSFSSGLHPLNLSLSFAFSDNPQHCALSAVK
ncbi:testican-1 isoform X1 [Tachysurus ichikawai]